MPRKSTSSASGRTRSARKKIIRDEDDEGDNNNDEEMDVEEVEAPSRGRRDSAGSDSSRRKRRFVLEEEEDDDDDADDDVRPDTMFSSQAPELSQEILPAKRREEENLMNMDENAREEAIRCLTRLVLFRALAGEPIDRAKCIKDANINDARISSAAFAQANLRLNNLFNFDLRRAPAFMEKFKNLPTKYKDRYYLVNTLEESGADGGTHLQRIHSVHEQSSIERGLLMTVLALAYCKGDPRSDGSRWILNKDLYYLLNGVDENIPSEPPANAGKRSKASITQTQSSSRFDGGDGVASTPNVDALLEKFCHLDYLLKETASEEQIASIANCEEGSLFYSAGPRAMLEVGRKQVIYFCAEILGEEPDPTMLMELQDDENDDPDREASAAL